MPTSPTIHPKFKFNGLSYTSAEELLNFVDNLKAHGAPYEVSIANFLEEWLDFGDSIVVKTSGSTGTPKDIFLLKEHMLQSAKATGAYFKTGEGTKALLCLSADYIAGKMMLVRALVLGWDLHAVAPNKDALTEYDNDYDFVAMVPFQLHHSIHALDKVKKMIVGGGPISPELEAQLQDKTTEVFATYGMTETITHVAVRRLNGFARSEVFSALPNVQFLHDDRGCLVIEAPKVSRRNVVTNDLVRLHSPVSFTWLGRIDNIINSGGVKISPEEVETKLSTHFDFPFIIASEDDEVLGQRIIMVIEGEQMPSQELYQGAFQELQKYERPKKIYSLSQFPFTETGKIKRQDVLSLLHKHK
ncbi:MAG: AMP-binding protein [Aureisphaera sp.]